MQVLQGCLAPEVQYTLFSNCMSCFFTLPRCLHWCVELPSGRVHKIGTLGIVFDRMSTQINHWRIRVAMKPRDRFLCPSKITPGDVLHLTHQTKSSLQLSYSIASSCVFIVGLSAYSPVFRPEETISSLAAAPSPLSKTGKLHIHSLLRIYLFHGTLPISF